MIFYIYILIIKKLYLFIDIYKIKIKNSYQNIDLVLISKVLLGPVLAFSVPN